VKEKYAWNFRRGDLLKQAAVLVRKEVRERLNQDRLPFIKATRTFSR